MSINTPAPPEKPAVLDRSLINSKYFSILFLPWWITSVIAIIALFTFRNYYEIIFWGISIDLIYGTGIALLYGFGLLFGLGALAVFVLSEILKKRIRFYS